MKIEEHKNLFPYFFEIISEAALDLKLGISELSQVNMIAVLDRFFSSKNAPLLGRTEDTLAKSYMEASQDGHIESFRELGDRALVMAGWFPHYFNNKVIGVNYCIDMGRAGYASYASERDPSFEEVSVEFKNCVETIHVAKARASELPEDISPWQRMFMLSGGNGARHILNEHAEEAGKDIFIIDEVPRPQ